MGAEEPLGEVLSQSEVERLLAQVAEQESTSLVHTTGGAKDRRSNDHIQPYDFRHPIFLSAGELRRLRLRHEEYIRSLAARLSIHLRLEFGLQMAKLNTITYQKFTEGLANPTVLTLFKVDPLRGICILDVNPRLGLTIVDRLMGGAAHSVAGGRDLTEIETALLDQAIHVMLSEWCTHWASLMELRPTLVGHENNGRFLQTAPHDTVMLVLAMEARLGDCMEQLQIGFPYYTLEPLVRKMDAELAAEARPAGPGTASSLKWNREFERVHVPITAEWDRVEISARQLAALKPGDVLPLGSECAHQVQVRLARVPKFMATLGTQGKRWAVALNEVLR